MIPLDDALRSTWLFGQTVHEGCGRGGCYERAEFAEEHGSRICIVKPGCRGPAWPVRRRQAKAVMTCVRAIHAFQRLTQASLNKEPACRGRRNG